MKKFVLLLIILFFSSTAFALNVVYPHKKQFQFNSDRTFFIGSSNPNKELFINGEKVEVHSSGGFAKVVKLTEGLNVFKLISGDDILIYNISRVINKYLASGNKDCVVFNSPKSLIVNFDKAPLRSTPEDFGINRISHLPVGMILRSNGIKNNFYRVILGDNNYGWISKDQVDISEENISKSVELKSYECKVDSEFLVCKFDLSARVPWEIVEGENLIIRLYNVSGYYGNIFELNLPANKIMGGKNLVGYSAKYDNNAFIFKLRSPLIINQEKPLENVRITIDPGHGGSELGTTGCLGDIEKNFNLQYAKDLKSVLEKRGAVVNITRKHDEFVSLQDRVNKTNDFNSSVFVSIHGNALPDNFDPIENSGTEIYYYYPQAYPLAVSVMNSIEKHEEFKNHGIFQKSFAVVRNTEALSILIEVGYMINPEDNSKIITKEFRKLFVESVADGLEEYFNSQ